MDYKFAYKLPDGDGGEKTVSEENDYLAKVKARAEIANFEDVNELEVELTLIAKGDFSSGRYYECEGCSS